MTVLTFKPLLSATLPVDADMDALPYPLWCSPKIDGVRAMVQRGVVVSRNGRPIPNQGVQAAFALAHAEGIDGELTLGAANGKDVFNATVSVVMSGAQNREEAGEHDVRFNIFDWCYPGTVWTFKERLRSLRESGWRRPFYVVRQTLVRTAEELRAYEEECLAQNYEGCMLRSVAYAGPYMQKRSTLREFALVKMKRVERAVASILAIYPLEHNTNEDRVIANRRSSKKSGIVVDKERVGSATLKDTESGVEFSVSVAGATLQKWPGWQDSKRWKGKRVAYKYQLCGTLNGVPRFPVCKFEELL